MTAPAIVPTAAGPWAGQLWLAAHDGLVAFSGNGGSAVGHAHHAIQAAVTFDHPMRVTIDGHSEDTMAVVIPSDVPHSLRAEGRIAMLWVDPHSRVGRTLGSERFREFAHAWATSWDGKPPTSAADLIEEVESLVAAGTGQPAHVDPPSEHVAGALEFLESHVGDRPSLAEVAARVMISPSRLTHLFTREVGIPFRRYVLWMRLKRALECANAGFDLTVAAAEAGFSDSAHLSRVFKKNFGLPPSTLYLMTNIQRGLRTGQSQP